MRPIGLSLLLVLLVGAGALPAGAVSLAYAFAGTLTSVDPAIAGQSPPFGVGDPFSATVVVDSGTVGQPSSNPVQLVYTPVTSMALVLNGTYTIQGNPPSSSIAVEHDPGNRDEFRASGAGLFGAADLGVWHTSTFALHLVDPSGSALASNALPTALDINDWAGASMAVTFTDTSGMASPVFVHGTIGTVGVTVPEPTTLALLGAGLSGLLVAGRRRTR